MLTPDLLKAKFTAALPYEKYLATGTPAQRDTWQSAERNARDHASLNSRQRAMLQDFTRKMPILVVSGLWCGDCAQQCPLLHIIGDGPIDLIQVRFLDRDQNLDLADQIKICGGLRVPVAIFMNEDFEFVSLLGDKTLHRFRFAATRKLGAACALPGADVPANEIDATMQDWIDEVERVQLLLRLSTKLRARHGD